MAKKKLKRAEGTLGRYEGEGLSHVAFPLGGMGAGGLCLEGTGALSHVAVRHMPDMLNEPLMFAALYVRGAKTARVIEGPVPMRKVYGVPRAGLGKGIKNFGLARFSEARFEAKFPFGRVTLRDEEMPVEVEVTGWSPFAPPDADSASLPVAGLEYRIRNTSKKGVKGVFSFHAKNFMQPAPHVEAGVRGIAGGFMLEVPEKSAAPHVASWWISKVFERGGGVKEAVCRGLNEGLDWQPAAMLHYFANAHARFSTLDGITYIGTKVKVGKGGTWEFRIGHDGPTRMFVDGKAVYTEEARFNPHKPDRARVEVALGEGEHEVMFAFDLCGGNCWGVSLTFGAGRGGGESGGVERRKLREGEGAAEHPLPSPPPDGEGAGKAEYPEPGAWTPAPPSHEGRFAAFVDEKQVSVDCAWVRGAWFDGITSLWNHVMAGRTPSSAGHADGEASAGGSLYVPFEVKAGEEKTVRVHLAWHVPKSGISNGGAVGKKEKSGLAHADESMAHKTYVPWYAVRFKTMDALMEYWRAEYDGLRARTQAFTDCFYDTTLPEEAIEAAAANLAILKSPTVLRQHDGRFWGWEGSGDAGGSCAGTCTHVWNYAQALCHLFPSLERTLRETEFFESQDESGHQNFRAALPIGPTSHQFHAAADGQLGGIIKVYREWRISGDTAWMVRIWPRVKASLDYCIKTWDPDGTGTVIEPHHNTYDIEFWGADGMCTSFYLSALKAAVLMGKEAGRGRPESGAIESRELTEKEGKKTHPHPSPLPEGEGVRRYEALLAKGKAVMEKALWNGEYFTQKVKWKGLRAADPAKALSVNTSYAPESLAILEKEGPKYQYGKGCLSDGVIGDWMARCAGLGTVLDEEKVKGHVASVFKHNFKESLKDHSNPQRPGYALGQEAGLLLCTWPKGGKPSFPFVYSDEVWTGIEYQVAAHLIMMGRVKKGLAIVRTARGRYAGWNRNPFNEYECGNWYARAMSSYSLIQALGGVTYDAVTGVLRIEPRVKGDFRAFISTATGFGTVVVRKGRASLKVVSGEIGVRWLVYVGR
jgi:uncharacterized protein (DUF608 family)